MPLLASLSNIQRTSPNSCLLLIEEDLSSFRPINVNVPGIGATGLSRWGSQVYMALQPSYLATLDFPSFNVLALHPLQKVSDVHSILAEGARIWALSSGTDTVFELWRQGDGYIEKESWRPNPDSTYADWNHINSVARWKGSVYVSAFGEKEHPSWWYSTKGFIKQIPSGNAIVEGLHQPHSLTAVGEDLFFCESSLSIVRDLSNARSLKLDSYTRGLCVANGSLYVATSKWRRAPDEGRCAVHQIDLETFRVKRELDLSHVADEIYDLINL